MGTELVTLRSAYRQCEKITWANARNFAYGIRLLPAEKRKAMAALYAMSRRIDDIGDGRWSSDRKLQALDNLHATIRGLEDGRIFDPGDPVLVSLGDAAHRFPIPLAALHEIVEGCEQDVRGKTYQTMAETVQYCRLVAGSVGRMSLGVFGAHSGPADSRPVPDLSRIADDLGVALQLTNMLRDIKEDLRMGRIYLPEQDRDRFGIISGRWAPPDRVAKLVEHVAKQTATWFDQGLPLLDYLDPRSRACTAAMAGIYRRVLRRIRSEPTRPLHERVGLPVWEKALVAARSLSGWRP